MATQKQEGDLQHNIQLLSKLENLGHKGYAKFREIIRHMNKEVDAFDDCLSSLDLIGWSPDDISKFVMCVCVCVCLCVCVFVYVCMCVFV